MSALRLLSTIDMARFVARGFLRFDAVVPHEINAQFMAEASETVEPDEGFKGSYRDAFAANAIPEGGQIADELALKDAKYRPSFPATK